MYLDDGNQKQIDVNFYYNIKSFCFSVYVSCNSLKKQKRKRTVYYFGAIFSSISCLLKLFPKREGRCSVCHHRRLLTLCQVTEGGGRLLESRLIARRSPTTSSGEKMTPRPPRGFITLDRSTMVVSPGKPLSCNEGFCYNPPAGSGCPGKPRPCLRRSPLHWSRPPWLFSEPLPSTPRSMRLARDP